MGAYLFVHFVGKENTPDCEQVYLSVSKDGMDWEILNDKKPILKSNLGEKGVRDPFVIKSHTEEKYFMIATDLSIYERQLVSQTPWYDCKTKGSKSIIIWESNDLVHWSEPRMVEVAISDAGCTWAPEAMYDKEKDAYIVYWASTSSKDNYEYLRMYYSYTKDFKEFTPAEIFIDNATDEEKEKGIAAANIDTTIIEQNGTYYRFTKNESKSSVIMDRSEHLSYGWESVKTYNLSEMKGYEGPTIFKMHNENKWCLMLDHFAAKVGYEPFITDDISKGIFKASGACNFYGIIYRHGSIIPISDEEYERLKNSL